MEEEKMSLEILTTSWRMSGIAMVDEGRVILAVNQMVEFSFGIGWEECSLLFIIKGEENFCFH